MRLYSRSRLLGIFGLPSRLGRPAHAHANQGPSGTFGLLGFPEAAEHLDQVGREWQHMLGGFALRRNKLTATVEFAHLLIDGKELVLIVDARPLEAEQLAFAEAKENIEPIAEGVAVWEALASLDDWLAIVVIAPASAFEQGDSLGDGQDFANALGISGDVLPHQCGVILWHEVIGKRDIENAGGEIDRVPNLADSVALVE